LATARIIILGFMVAVAFSALIPLIGDQGGLRSIKDSPAAIPEDFLSLKGLIKLDLRLGNSRHGISGVESGI